MNQNHLSMPNKKSVEDAIRVVEEFRELCRHQLELGYWATVDFPSKHHLNRLLGLAYRKPEDLVSYYGDGLTRHVHELLPFVRAYAEFTRPVREAAALEQTRQQATKPPFLQEPHGKVESKEQPNTP